MGWDAMQRVLRSSEAIRVRATRSYLIRGLRILTLVSVASSSIAIARDSVALRLFNEWLVAFNSGDDAQLTRFWNKYGGNEQPDDRVALDIRHHDRIGILSTIRILVKDPKHAVALMKDGHNAYSESTVDLLSADPPVIARIVGHPVRSPTSIPAPAIDDADLKKKVQGVVARMAGADAFSGVILIAHHGKIVLEQAWGLADATKHTRNTIDTQFGLASMNKMFTAISVLQLVNRGSLRLDDPIGRYLPNYTNHELAATVTVRELLTHTGGTGDFLTPEFTAHKA